MKIYNFFNKYHLGDCLISLHFINKLVEFNDIKCNFYCNESYHNQLSEIINFKNKIFLLSDNHFNGIDLWCSNSLRKIQSANPDKYPFYCKENLNLEDVGQMIFKSYELICIENNLTFPFKNKNDIVFDEIFLNEESKIGYYDFILINSDCLSGQIKFTENEKNEIFSNIINTLIKAKKTFITTKKYNSFPCTLDFGLTIAEIGKLTKKCIGIIGFPTSPFWICLNKQAFDKQVKYINITQDICTFEFSNKIITVNSNFENISNTLINTYNL